MVNLIYVSGDTQAGRWAALRSMDGGWFLVMTIALTEPANTPGATPAGKRELREKPKRH